MVEKAKRGFAAMDPEQQRQIASEGGRASHRSGNAHEFDSNEAAEAGPKGDESVRRDRSHMAEIGSAGGRNSHHGNAAFHHESAAHHHRQAARHQKEGNQEDADRHTRVAHSHSQAAHEHSRRGFAAMDPEQQREIARKGGEASHGGRGRQREDDNEENNGNGNGGRGFAGMDPEQQREIAAKGGRASGGGQSRRQDEEENDNDEDEDSDEDEGNGEEMDFLSSGSSRKQQAGNGRSRGGSSEQHAKAGRQSHKNN